MTAESIAVFIHHGIIFFLKRNESAKNSNSSESIIVVNDEQFQKQQIKGIIDLLDYLQHKSRFIYNFK